MITVISEAFNDDNMDNEIITSFGGSPVGCMESPSKTTCAGTIASQGDFDEYKQEVSSDEAQNQKIDYANPKYQRVVDYLNHNGYPGSKFLGKMGFFIPQNTNYVSLVFDDICSECSIMTTRNKLKSSLALEYAAELTKASEIAEQINSILADATDADTKDRHVDESLDMRAQKIIESGDPNFGKPGNYILYRNGSHQTKRGFISFSDTKAGADKYSQDGRQTEKFAVTIKNPYIAKGNTSYEAFCNLYKSLVSKAIVIDPSLEKINDAWRRYDGEIAEKLSELGYDSFIYLVPQANEVNVLGADIDKMPSINEYNESVPQALGTN